MIRSTQQRGYILLPVVIMLTLVATVAFTINHESALDSGVTSSQMEAKQAEAVAMAGINHALWQTRQQGCGPYTDLTNKALDKHSYTTTLTTDLGSTNAYTISVDQDTWIRSDQPTNNYSSDPRLHIRFETGIIERPMLRFDLSPVPGKANILSATAWFYVNKEHPEGPVDIHLINTDWTDTTATWDSMGANIDSAVQASIPAQPAAGVWVAVNLTSQVQAWVNGLPNYGITLNSTSEGTYGEYASREAGQQPYLDVIVGTPPSSPAMLNSVGVLASGISRTITREDVWLYQQPSHRMVEPGAVNTDDAWITGTKTSWNYGGSNLLNVNENGGPQRGIVRFDLSSSIPLGARVTSATLELFAPSVGGTGFVRLYGLQKDWVEGACSGGCTGAVTWDTTDGSSAWGTPGSDADIAAVAEVQAGNSNIWYSWDITSIARQWISGERPNYGLLIKGEGADVVFNSSDHANASMHPKLTVTYSCECGQACVAPSVTGKILFVVSNEWGLTANETAKKALFESWGYSVDLISQWDVSWNFNNKAANNDVVYVSEAVSSTTWGMAPVLASTSLGVVNEEGALNDEFGIASGRGWPVGNSFTVADNSHYITWPFGTGDLQIFDAAMEGLSVSGSEAAGLRTLADWGGIGGLVVLDTGAALDGGGTAPGRRVMLPLGRDNKFNTDYLNANGRLIVQRALAWGMRADAALLGTPLLLVVADDTSLTADEDAKKTLIESWGYVVNLIDDSDSQATFDAAVIANNVVFISGDISAAALGTKLRNAPLGIVNERIDLVDEFGFAQNHRTNAYNNISVTDNTHDITTGFSTGWLSVAASSQPLQALDGTLAPGLRNLAEVWIIGANYDDGLAVLDTGAVLYGGGVAAGRRAQLPWGSTGFSFSALNSNGRTIMQRAIEWAATPPVPKAPVAHWKLDETGGMTAVDSAGGHDGTLVNGPVWAGGQLDGALDFDGSDDRIDVPHDDALSLLDKMTFTAWVNASSYGTSYQTIIAKDDGGAVSNYWFGTWRQELAFGFFVSGSFREVFTTGLNLQPNTWYHLAAMFDNTADVVVLYVDGVPVHKDVMTFSPSAVPADLTIGRSPDGEYWPGLLDDVRIYDELLSTTEIGDLATVPPIVPVAHWKLDETTGKTAVDSIAGHDGTLINDPVWTVGIIDGALDFDGGDDHVLVPDTPSLDITDKITLSAWIRPNRTDTQYVIRKAQYDSTDGYELSLSTTGEVFFRLNQASNANTYRIDSTTSYPTDGSTWMHIAATYDGADLRLYINGVEEASMNAAISIATNDTDLSIGAQADGSRVIDGLVDDVKLFRDPLPADDIAALAAGGGGGSPLTGCDGTFRDEFNLEQYDQNDGTLTWATNWEETGETTDPTADDIRIDNDISDFQLMLRDDGQTVMREADLSEAGSATLSFDYRRENLKGSGDYVAVEVSYNGGNSWTELDRFTGDADDSTYSSASYPLDAGSLSANTRIRFLTPGNGMKDNNQVWFDNIQIQCSP